MAAKKTTKTAPKAPAKKTAAKAPAAKKIATKKAVKAPPAKAKKAPKAANTGTYENLREGHSGASAIKSPVKVAWDIFSADPNLTRKDAITKAVDVGVSYYTARTQYQLWLTAYRNSK